MAGLPTASSIHFTPSKGVVGAAITVAADQGLSTVTAISVNGVPVVPKTLTFFSDTSLSFGIPIGATTGPVKFTNPSGTVISIDVLTVVFDTPVQSWNDLPSRTQSLYKIRERYVRTDDPLPNIPYIPLEECIPDDTDHHSSIAAPAGSLPTAGSIAFSKNPALVGDVVTVTANKGFLGVNVVKIGNVNVLTFDVVNDTSLTMVIPAAARTGTVSITNSFGTVSATTQLKIAVLPTASSIHFNPTGGIIGMTIVVSADKGLSTVTAISFNAIPVVTKTLFSDTSLSFVIPAGSTTGTVQFTNLAGAVTSIDVLTMAVLPTAALIHFTPTSGAVGATITVAADKGLGFITAITMGTVSVVTFNSISGTSLTFVIPPGAPTGPVKFTNPAGTVTSVDILTVVAGRSAELKNELENPGEVFEKPEKITVELESEPENPGEVLEKPEKITEESEQEAEELGREAAELGRETEESEKTPEEESESIIFSKNPAMVRNVVMVMAEKGLVAVTAVMIGNVHVHNFRVISDTSLTLTIPGAARTGTVYLKNRSGTVLGSALLKIAVLPTASSIRFAPTKGAVGEMISVSADKGLSTVTAISVHDVPVLEMTPISDTNLTFVIPDGAMKGTVQFKNLAGRVTSFNILTVT